MPKLTIIVGMAGSGKTHLGREICKAITKQNNSHIFFSSDATLVNSDERRAGYKCFTEIVARLLGRSEDCIMDESHLTVPAFRQRFHDFCCTYLHEIEQDWWFFKPNVLGCINNLYVDAQSTTDIQSGRNKLSRYVALDGQRKVYDIPDESKFPDRKIIDVYSCEKPQFSNEDQAIKWLQSEIKKLKRP